MPALDTASFIQLDLPAMLAALLATFACAPFGNFLALRRQSLTGDTVSHAVLPGLVASFLLLGTRAGWATLAGALVAASSRPC